MRALYRIVARFLGLFRRNERDDELAREMAAHLDMVTDEYVRRGMNPHEARRQALLESGGIEQAKEAVRDQRTMPRVEAVMRDVSFSLRSLRRSPGYALPVIASLALGIGLNTAAFTMVEDVLRRPLPYPNEAELLTVGIQHAAHNDYEDPSVEWSTLDQDLAAWKDGSRTLDAIAAFYATRTMIDGPQGPEYVLGVNTTANLLTVLGTQTTRGRWFTEQEVAERVVVLSHDLWSRQFAQNPNVLGQTLKIRGTAYVILGVLAPGIGLPLEAQYWTPCNRCLFGQIVARPKPGTVLATIKLDLEALSPSVKNTRQAGSKVQLVVMSLHEQLFGSARPALQLLTGAAALLFLIACANIANLSLARTLERRRELAVRVALGAGRKSLAMLVLAENLLLATVGAVAGLAVAYAVSGVLVSLAPAEITNVRNVNVNIVSAMFAFVLATTAGIAVSVTPVLSITGDRGHPMMGQWSAGSGRGRRLSRVRYVLVTAQLGLTLLLMTGAGLLIRSVAALARPDRLGFSPQGVVIANVRLGWSQYGDSTSWRVFTERFMARLQSLPGVQSVAVGPAPLLAGKGSLAEGVDGVFSYRDPLQPAAPSHNIWVKEIGVDYLKTFGIKLKTGRNFQITDDANAVPVAMINTAAARALFQDRNPIGLPLPTRAMAGTGRPAQIVVGVVDDVLQRDLTMPTNPEVLFPAAQRGFSTIVTLAIRTNAPINATVLGAREALREIDPSLAASRLESMESILADSLSTHTFLLWLLVTFASLALVLSVIGLYAIVSYLVSQRTIEIGVRIALGAQRFQVFGLVLGEGAVLLLAGVAIGSLAAFAFSQLLSKFLYEVHPHDALTSVVGPLILSIVALVAAYVPAMRASRVNPAITLRAD